jgi:hypothetical protein
MTLFSSRRIIWVLMLTLPLSERTLTMKKNIGTADRIVRIFLAAIFGILLFTGAVSGLTAITLGVLAVVFLSTSVVSTCPLYLPFKISTRSKP